MDNVNMVNTVFSKNYHFKAGILCTYGLNLNFFENYVMKLDAIYSCDNICIFTDSGTYDGFIKESYSPRWLNKKYLVTRVKAGGVFHPKLYMFASEKKALVGIGSANLTRDGIASNLELLSVFEISEKDGSYAPLLHNCIEYIKRLTQSTKSKIAAEQVNVFDELCRAYLYSNDENGIRFIHNLDSPIIDSIKDYAKNFHISKIQVLSPFYDTDLFPLKELLRAFPGSEVEIYLQQKKSNFPIELFGEIKSQASLLLYKNVDRYMHGKAILLHGKDAIVLFIGSANFTRSALNLVPPEGNYEVGLIGQINRKTAESLLCPAGKKAVKVKKVEDIEVSPSGEFECPPKFVEYITEALLNKNSIKVATNSDVSPKTFSPEKFRLIDFNANTHEEKINENFIIELTPIVKKKVPGKLAVQILGRDKQGKLLESNIAWVIELEEKSSDPLLRRFRRIYNDPFELIEILHEIMETRDGEELKLFLLTFDIPLDLVLPPRNYQRSTIVKSKGNVEGVLPWHYSYIFSASIKDAYADCLNRLYKKLERHLENPQANKVNNFVTILSSLYSLIWFISTESIYEGHKDISLITPDAWALIRDYYDMLLRYIDDSCNLVWSKGGYRDAINAKIAKDRNNDKQNGVRSFEQYLAEEYNYTFDELTNLALQTIDHFEQLKETLRVKTAQGETVKPVVFPNNHMYLQPNKLHKISEAIKQPVQNLQNFPKNSIK